MNETFLDKIHIRDLCVSCVIGIFPEERVKQQEIVLNITLHADLFRAGTTDSIEDTVDYKRVKKQVLALVADSSYFLLEKLAQKVADICLEDPLVHSVTVTADKPGALRYARSVAVEIRRSKPYAGSHG